MVSSFTQRAEQPDAWLGPFSCSRHRSFRRILGGFLKWLWVNTYRYIFSGMNIHLPAILGFTRYQGFDPSPNGGTPTSSIFSDFSTVNIYKSSILGYPYGKPHENGDLNNNNGFNFVWDFMASNGIQFNGVLMRFNVIKSYNRDIANGVTVYPPIWKITFFVSRSSYNIANHFPLLC